jgi:prephenate dehydrogenase
LKIGVIGLGLIGGSIFKRLSEIDEFDVVGVSQSVDRENVSRDYDILNGCDFVFVCTPMNVVLDVLSKIEGIVNEDTIVTDVCSLKEFVSKKKYKYKFIPSHPMAGTENQGWKYSNPLMFDGAAWIITPINENDNEELDIFKSILSYFNVKIVITTPKEHDRAVAFISHLPMVVAQAFCKNIENDDLSKALVSSGFRDTTRLALTNIEMACDMVKLNKENIELAWRDLNSSFNFLLNSDYENEIRIIKKFRKNLYN